MIWGAFSNASQAMMASSWDMGTISQNISNVNTTGYKRKETLFKTVMSESHAAPSTYSGRLNIFGVGTADRNLISAQGTITASTTTTDLAINGRGFFMVAPPSVTTSGSTVTTSAPTEGTVENPDSVLYTRAGNFGFVSGPNQEKYFTVGGNYVLGWMADDTGAVDTGGSLEPVYTLPETTMEGRTTTSASIVANLPRDAAMTATNYDSTVSVTDPFGDTKELTLTWTRVDGNTWTVTPSTDGAVGSVTTGPITVTMDALGNISEPTDFTSQSIEIDWDDGTYGGATANSTETVNLSSDKPSVQLNKIYLSVFDSNFTEHSVTMAYERSGVNTWYLHALPGENGTDGATPDPIELTFSEDGKLLTGSPSSLSLSWTDSDGVVGTATVSVNMDELTQYDGTEVYVKTTNSDGYGSGTLVSSGFNEKGEMIGQFTNGKSRTLFKLPIAQFVSEDNLEPISGTLFKRTAAAGDISVSAVEDAVGAPRFATSSLETSTVDIGDEFTKMIVTQKAYSTNATVFKTADEMTTTARDLKA